LALLEEGEEEGRMSMTKDAIRLCIKRHDSVHSIERMYLHHKGFTDIGNLEEFTQVRCLFLEANELTKIKNLNELKNLEILHIQKNKIGELCQMVSPLPFSSKFGTLTPHYLPLPINAANPGKIENLHHCSKLKYLNLAQNSISKIEGLESLPCLETLILSDNELSMPDFITNITSVPKLRELDLSLNKINCNAECILKILASCSNLRVLNLQGNPFIKKMPHYRSMIISHCKRLKQLDGRRICSEERRRCNAWGSVILNGGTFDQANEADKLELLKIRHERSQQNALRRSSSTSTSQSSNNIVSSTPSSETETSMGSIRSVVEGVKRTLGLPESRTSSSDVSWISYRNYSCLELDCENKLSEESRIKKSRKSDISSTSSAASFMWKRRISSDDNRVVVLSSSSSHSPRGID
jgi:dynein assembly factor 1